jgi:pyruvate kinase
VVAIAPNGIAFVPDRLADAALFAPADWVSDLSDGDIVQLDDLRLEHVRLEVTGRTDNNIVLTRCAQIAFVAPGCIARKLAADGARGPEVRIGELPPLEEPIRLKPGDTLIIRQGTTPGRRAILDDYGRTTAPAVICCNIAELYADVRQNEPVWFDDGRIGGVVRAAPPGEIEVTVTKAKPRGSKLRANKGINFPNSNLTVSAISSKDIEDLDFIAEHADIVGMSFASRPEDIAEMHCRLESRKANLPVMLKIETLRGFNHLPQLLMAAMRRFPLGLMIARGDCAVECGFERLAEIQEEILWLCEAAHVPVVWATQVLETLSKQGYPSRAEVTDAAMAERAECVMLGRGPYIVEAVASLDGILRRMEAHQMKKMSRLRRLQVSEQTFTDARLEHDGHHR